MKKTFLFGGIAAAAVLVGGWAYAQSAGFGGSGPGGMHNMMAGGMHGMTGRGMHGGMHGGMGPGMHGQMGPGMRGPMGPGMHGGSGAAALDPARIDALKAELAITPAQEPAWTKYAQAVKDAASTMTSARESVDRDAVSKMTPADRYAFVSKMREQGQKQFEAVQTAAKELLATLDDKQKASAEEILPGIAFGPGSTRGAGMGMHRHGRQ